MKTNSIPKAKTLQNSIRKIASARLEKEKQRQEAEWLKFTKRVDVFFNTGVPKRIKIAVKEEEYEVSINFPTYTTKQQTYLVERAKTILEPLGYKGIYHAWDNLVFNWKIPVNSNK